MSFQDAGDGNDQLVTPENLAEQLLNAAAAGELESELKRARIQVERSQDALDPLQLFRFRVLFFDVAVVSTADPLIKYETATELLAGACESGDRAWDAIRGSNRLDEIERLAHSAPVGLELLELLAYAPDAGMRGFAVSRIESAGMRALDSGLDSRSFERLLHAIGASEDAYRLESARKQRGMSVWREAMEAPTGPTLSAFRVIALAGGHAQLRGAAAILLQRRGIETVPIPSSREAVRRERDIVQLMQGCDLAMVLVRQITHSTSDQVRKAADRIGVPWVYSNALSAIAIERQLFELER